MWEVLACRKRSHKQAVLLALALLVGDTDHEQEAQFPLSALVHCVLAP